MLSDTKECSYEDLNSCYPMLGNYNGIMHFSSWYGNIFQYKKTFKSNKNILSQDGDLLCINLIENKDSNSATNDRYLNGQIEEQLELSNSGFPINFFNSVKEICIGEGINQMSYSPKEYSERGTHFMHKCKNLQRINFPKSLSLIYVDQPNGCYLDDTNELKDVEFIFNGVFPEIKSHDVTCLPKNLRQMTIQDRYEKNLCLLCGSPLAKIR